MSSSRLPDLSCPFKQFRWGFSWAMFFCQDVTDHWTLSGSADYPLFVCRDHSTPPLLGCKLGVCPVASDGVMSIVLGFRLAVKTAPSSTSHFSMGVYKKPVSMFTTYSVPRSVPMLSVMKLFQPTRIAVSYRGFDQSRRRSLRAVALAGGRWSLSMVTSPSCHSATVVLSRSLMPASNLRGRLAWFQGSHGQLCIWNEEHLGKFYVFSPVIGVSDGSMSASEKGFGFAIREGRRELAAEVGRVSERTRFKRSSGSSCARSRALRSIAPDVDLECSSSDEDEVSLARRESRAKHVPSCRVLDMQRVVVRWDASCSFLTILRWCERSAKDAHNVLQCFQSCFGSLRMVSGPASSPRSGGYRPN